MNKKINIVLYYFKGSDRMKKKKIKKQEKKLKEPVVMAEAAYNLSPDDIEIGDEIITHRELKEKKKIDKDD